MAAAKTKKAVNKTDIAHKAERWAKHRRDIAKLERAKQNDSELAAILRRHEEELAPVLAQYDPTIESLEARAARIREEIEEWFAAKKASLSIESKNAIAQLTVGTKFGNREADKKKLQELCERKGVDFYSLIVVLLGDADKALGKKEVDAVCKRETKTTRIFSLELKG